MSSGLTVFILFFGIAALDAVRGGDWLRVLFWVGIGAAFWLLDRRRPHPRRQQPDRL